MLIHIIPEEIESQEMTIETESATRLNTNRNPIMDPDHSTIDAYDFS
jgi:hypothetical protein